MDNNIELEIELGLECNCCCEKEKKIIICSYNNCDYPLCENCMNKILETNKLCPSCRRDINLQNINLEKINNELNQPIYMKRIFFRIIYFLWRIVNKLIYIYTLISCDNIFNTIYWFFIFFIIFTILTLIGRLVTYLLILGPSDFFCYSTGIIFILFYLLWSLLGIIILLIILILILFLISFFFKVDDQY